MTHNELRQAAIDCLARAFKGEGDVQPYVVQAAVSIALTPKPKA